VPRYDRNLKRMPVLVFAPPRYGNGPREAGHFRLQIRPLSKVPDCLSVPTSIEGASPNTKRSGRNLIVFPPSTNSAKLRGVPADPRLRGPQDQGSHVDSTDQEQRAHHSTMQLWRQRLTDTELTAASLLRGARSVRDAIAVTLDQSRRRRKISPCTGRPSSDRAGLAPCPRRWHIPT